MGRRWAVWMRAGAALLSLVLASSAAGAEPTPRHREGLLPVPLLARVSDPGNLLSARDRAALEARLASFEAQQGSQIAIVLVDSTQPEPIEDYAHRVGDAWKIGRRGIGDGVLIVVAVRDRRARIDVARSLEGAIPDVVAGRIVREDMAPHFAGGDYAGGLSAALDAVFARLGAEGLPAGTGEATRHKAGELSQAPSWVWFALIALALVLRAVLGALGALLAAAGVAILVGIFSSSWIPGIIAGVFVFGLLMGRFVFLPGIFSGGGSWGSSGGFRSGGGGDFSGGGASGSW